MHVDMRGRAEHSSDGNWSWGSLCAQPFTISGALGESWNVFEPQFPTLVMHAERQCDLQHRARPQDVQGLRGKPKLVQQMHHQHHQNYTLLDASVGHLQRAPGPSQGLAREQVALKLDNLRTV